MRDERKERFEEFVELAMGLSGYGHEVTPFFPGLQFLQVTPIPSVGKPAIVILSIHPINDGSLFQAGMIVRPSEGPKNDCRLSGKDGRVRRIFPKHLAPPHERQAHQRLRTLAKFFMEDAGVYTGWKS